MDWNDDLWVRPAIPVDGVLRPGEAPGHGIAFKPDVLRDHRVGGNEVTAR
jgi:L-alanine-DL-glutamate epimerase-like enolase superfamily enzyme